MKRFLFIGGLGVVLIVLALGLNFWMASDDDGVPEEAAPVAVVPVPATPASEASTPETAVPETPAPRREPAEPETATAPPVEEPPTETPSTEAPQSEPPVAEPPAIAVVPRDVPDAPQAARPEFDVARVMPNGDAVFAGRAAAGADVTVLDGGTAVGTVMADSRGEWVLVAPEPLSPGSHELGLSARLGDGEPIQSDSVLVVVVPEPGRDIAGRDAPDQSGALALEVPREGFGASNVLQRPTPATAPETDTAVQGGLGVEVLDYDEAGNLSLTGTAGAGSDVRVYLDNALLGHTRADADGRWRLVIEKPIEPGLYTVRVDEVAGDRVVARLEFPFERVTPQIVEEGSMLVVVQPGNSLWRIARRTLGEGVKFTVIYEANRDRIRDPDLIYPGQIFSIPRTN